MRRGYVTRKVATVSPARTGADHYIELGFTGDAGALVGTSGVIQLRFWGTNFQAVDETDDYSFIESAEQNGDFVLNDHITVYHDGMLIWGTEPP
jgi:hypothetical protein